MLDFAKAWPFSFKIIKTMVLMKDDVISMKLKVFVADLFEQHVQM